MKPGLVNSKPGFFCFEGSVVPKHSIGRGTYGARKFLSASCYKHVTPTGVAKQSEIGVMDNVFKFVGGIVDINFRFIVMDKAMGETGRLRSQ